ncbi:hypothetical protein R3P38DRAFT_1647513 [Favolaschia claudopus]|uniref:C2H2-type domain-containing protein n=1 Tax=Favolaschia claudopus TaxID=2862362 RepID=A0AAW0DMT1_9AGAR
MQQESPMQSLLSLSIAASSAQPIPIALSTNSTTTSNPKHPAALNHRRLSSTGRRRRLSDARDAASRPLSVGSPAGLSIAALSLASPPPQDNTPPEASKALPASAPPPTTTTPIPIGAQAANGNGRSGKKRGVDHKCETCSKIYRHPSCLIKHRWEHTPHWRTLASLPHPGPNGTGGGAVLSKHAQVQLLEAAAILSHLSPDSETGTSLPEDRGMWPRWVSGGALEGEEGSSYAVAVVPGSFGSVGEYPPSSVGSGSVSVHGTSASVGARGHGHGPRLHDYEVPRGVGAGEQRKGVVEVPHLGRGHAHSYSHSHSHSLSSYSYSHASANANAGGWSVPRSVSVSASSEQSRSQSRSTPSDDEEEEDDEDDDEDQDEEDMGMRTRGRGRGRASARVYDVGEEFGFDFDFGLDGVREEGEDDHEEEVGGRASKVKSKQQGNKEKGRGGYGSSERWGGMEEMDDIDMDMD